MVSLCVDWELLVNWKLKGLSPNFIYWNVFTGENINTNYDIIGTILLFYYLLHKKRSKLHIFHADSVLDYFYYINTLLHFFFFFFYLLWFALYWLHPEEKHCCARENSCMWKKVEKMPEKNASSNVT